MRKNVIVFLLACILLVAAGGCGTAQAVGPTVEASIGAERPYAPVGWCECKTLCAFRSETELRPWQLRSTNPPCLFELAQDPTGQASAHVIYRKYPGAGEQWPAIILNAPDMAVTDWTAYRYLRFHVCSSRGAELPLRVHVRNRAGERKSWSLKIEQNAQLAEIDLDAQLRSKNDMAELHFFMTRPQMDEEFYVRDVQLCTEDVGVAIGKQCEMLRQRRVEASVAGQAADELLLECDELQEELAASYAVVKASPGVVTGQAALKAIARAREWLAREDLARIIVRAPYLAAVRRAPEGASFYYGVESSMRKVMWEDLPFKGMIGGEAVLFLAGDEEESVQVVVLVFKDVRGLRAKLSWQDESCPLEAELGWMGHVKTQAPPYQVPYVGWWPDPILTFLEEVDVPADHAESLWVTVRAPRGTPAGWHSGSIELASADGGSVRVAIRVKIFGFDLPPKRHLPLAITWADRTQYVYAKSEAEREAYLKAVAEGLKPSEATDPAVRRMLEIRRRTADFLLRKRVDPDHIYRSSPPDLDEVEEWLQKGMTCFNIVYVPRARNVKAGQPYPASGKRRLLDILERTVPEVRRRGLMRYAYVYGFDEVREDNFAAMIDVLGEIKRRWPDLKIMTTARDLDYGRINGLTKVIDIWVPLTPGFSKTLDAINDARAGGDEVWWYICIGPKHPYANWLIEYPAIEARLLMGYMAFRMGTQGFLYYQMSRWVHKDYADPIKKPITTGPLTDWDPRSYKENNGDGSIFCGGPDGPLSTIRLENIRDGLEDYEYLWMVRRALEQLESGAKSEPRPGWEAEARERLVIGPPLMNMMTDFTHDPVVLVRHRDRLGALLEQWAAVYGRATLE